MTHVSNTNKLHIHVYDPIVWGTGQIVSDELFELIDSYTHEISAFGWYDSASIKLTAPLEYAQEWFSRGLGRDIHVHSPSLRIIFEGFVNKITINNGNLSRTIGPLLDITNKVRVAYTEVDTSTTIPLVGIETTTDWYVDQESIDKYGEFSTVLNGGRLSSSEAYNLANAYLAEHSVPAKNESIELFASRATSIDLDIKGYFHWLSYKYNNTAGSGTVNKSTKLQDIITADPNGIFSTDFSLISVDATQVEDYEDQDREALALVKSLVLSSDSSFNRYVFGVGKDRTVFYKTIPEDVRYINYPFNTSGRLFDLRNTPVAPWDIVPGEFIINSYEDIGKVRYPATIKAARSLPGYMFIEKLRFTLPNRVTLTDGKIGSLNERISTFKSLSGSYN